jgi:hypothetical protein
MFEMIRKVSFLEFRVGRSRKVGRSDGYSIDAATFGQVRLEINLSWLGIRNPINEVKG